MPRVSRVLSLVGSMLSVFVMSTPGWAGAGHQPRILLHLDSMTTKSQCSRAELACCSDAVTRGTLNQFYFLCVLAAPSDSMFMAGAGIGGIQFGLNYMGGLDPNGNIDLPIDIFSWNLCAALEFASPDPAWPNPGSGTIITWDSVNSCPRGPVAVAGYFYMTAYQARDFRLVVRPADQEAKLVSCDLIEYHVDLTFTPSIAAFSSGATVLGWNPCSGPCPTTAVQPATWSRIKAQGGR